MNTLNSIATKTNQLHKQFIPSLHQHHRLVFTKPHSFLSFKTPPQLPSFSSHLPIKASSKHEIPKLTQPLTPTLIATITATALLFTRFYFNPKPAISAPVETIANDSISQEEKDEKALGDVDALRNLVETHIKNRKLDDAISTVERLIELEPNEAEFHFLKSHLHVRNGELELAKIGFNRIILNDPFNVEAYHGLVMAATQADSLTEELKEIEKKTEEGIIMCKKENKNKEMWEFKLLLAQIRVIEGKYDDALKVYGVLSKEEPGDFRPYLCQGIIYRLLKNKDEAEKYFEKFKRLVPKEDANDRYFEFLIKHGGERVERV